MSNKIVRFFGPTCTCRSLKCNKWLVDSEQITFRNPNLKASASQHNVTRSVYNVTMTAALIPFLSRFLLGLCLSEHCTYIKPQNVKISNNYQYLSRTVAYEVSHDSFGRSLVCGHIEYLHGFRLTAGAVSVPLSAILLLINPGSIKFHVR